MLMKYIPIIVSYRDIANVYYVDVRWFCFNDDESVKLNLRFCLVLFLTIKLKLLMV